jgi:hypothetical protein
MGKKNILKALQGGTLGGALSQCKKKYFAQISHHFTWQNACTG